VLADIDGDRLAQEAEHERLHVFTHPERIAEARSRFARITDP
jgi:hypothetical protein